MRDNQWRLDMMDGIVAASQAGMIDKVEVDALRTSIKKSVDHQHMDADTRRRTNGKCPTTRSYLQRQYKALAKACAKCWNPQKEDS